MPIRSAMNDAHVSQAEWDRIFKPKEFTCEHGVYTDQPCGQCMRDEKPQEHTVIEKLEHLMDIHGDITIGRYKGKTYICLADQFDITSGITLQEALDDYEFDE